MTERKTGLEPPEGPGGGESQGGAYPNPHRGKQPRQGGFMGHGGQSEIGYSGADNPNAPAAEGDEAEVGHVTEGRDQRSV